MLSKYVNIRAWAILAAAGTAAPALAQDSVPTAPGGNDALSPYVGSSQRVRYVVDAAAVQTSWGQTVLVAPVLKASRESDPMFRTLILGSGAVSPTLAENISFASRSYALWTTPGQGVHPSANTAPGSVARTGHQVQIGAAASEFGIARSGVLGAAIGFDMSQPSRLYVERVMALASRSSDGAADTATLSLGAVDAFGFVALRADNFNTDPGTATRVLGENILRVNTSARSAAVNSLAAFGGTNFASDAAATAYIISNESIPTNTPTLAPVAGSAPAAVAFDFASRLRMGTSSANLATSTGHLHAAIAGHRGNPTFSPLATLPGGSGGIGSIASPAKADAPVAKIAAVNVFDLAAGAPGGPPVVDAASRRSYVLPSPLSIPGYTTNSAGLASNTQYLSQSAFRGGNGQVGIGLDGDARVLAMAISDPGAGESIVVVRDGGAPIWTIAAHPGQDVLNSAPPAGTAIGTLSNPLAVSAPAVDLLGNVYFVASWQPSGPEPEGRGLFKAVNVSGTYHLELLLATGQQIAGPNSGRTYTIAELALRDGDSIASGAFHAQQLVQQQLPGAGTSDPASIFAAGGLSVHAVLDYDNAGTSETYDAVLLVLPGGTLPPPECAADFDDNGAVEVTDIFTFLTAWFAGDPDAFEFGGTPGVPAIFAFLTAWFAGC